MAKSVDQTIMKAIETREVNHEPLHDYQDIVLSPLIIKTAKGETYHTFSFG